MTLNIDPRRCKVEGCRGWANKTTGYCAGHDPQAQAVASQARKLARRGLKLPPLDSPEHAKEWFKIIGAALGEDRLKPGRASELRRLAVAYLDSDPSSILTDRLEAVEDALQRLSSKEEHWQG